MADPEERDLGSGSLLRFVRDGVLWRFEGQDNVGEGVQGKGCVYLISIFFLARFARQSLTFI